MEAIKRLPTQFTESELEPIVAKARVHFSGLLRSTFVVLNDGAPRRSRPTRQPAAATATPAQPDAHEEPDEPEAAKAEGEAVEDISSNLANRKRRGAPLSSSQPGSQRQRF